jgi:hypothetical protein
VGRALFQGCTGLLRGNDRLLGRIQRQVGMTRLEVQQGNGYMRIGYGKGRAIVQRTRRHLCKYSVQNLFSLFWPLPLQACDGQPRR